MIGTESEQFHKDQSLPSSHLSEHALVLNGVAEGWGGGAHARVGAMVLLLGVFLLACSPKLIPSYAVLGNQGRVLRVLFLEVQAGWLWVQASN